MEAEFALMRCLKEKVDINLKAYHIQREQLHLFYKTNWVDTRAK